MATFTAIAGILCLALAIVVAIGNPRRSVNRAFAFVILIVGGYLGCVSCSIHQHQLLWLQQPNSVIFWARANAAVISFLPLAVGFVSAAVCGPASRRQWRILNVIIGIGGVTAAYLTTHPSFVHFTPDQRLARGASYYTLSVFGISIYIGCLIMMFRQLPHVTGVRRLELKLVALYSAGSGILLSGLNALGNYLKVASLKEAGIVILFGASLLLGWSLLFRRVFAAGEILARIARDSAVVSCTALVLLFVWQLGVGLGTSRIALLALTAAPVALFFHWSAHTWLYGATERRTASLRRRLIEAAASEFTPGALKRALCTILAAEFGAHSVAIVSPDDHDFTSVRHRDGWSQFGPKALIELGWATPESLDRMRPSPTLVELRDLLKEENASLILCVPRGSRTPSLLTLFAEKKNGAPFTYPEITRIFGLLELVDNILTRSRLTEQAALRVRMEHLAMLSRGLAHDLKNLITPVSSFLVHTDGKYTPGTPEAEVHAAARRSVRIMTDYIREALFFSERLAPRFDRTDIGSLFDAVRDATAARARQRNLTLVLHPGSIASIVADAILLQRMLANLVANAIDASSPGQVVTLTAAPGTVGRIMVKVIDQGAGIAPEHLSRIFEPYFTTKEFGDDVRGFGLGLTIVKKIIDLHSGTISVQSRLGEGTSISIDLPTSQLASLGTGSRRPTATSKP